MSPVALKWPSLPNLTCVNSRGITEGVTHISVIGAWSSAVWAGLAPALTDCQTDFTQGPSSLESKRSVRTGRGSKAGGNAACEREHVCMSLGSCQWRGGLLVLFGLRTWDRAVRVIKIQILRTAVEYFREWVMTQTLPFLRPNSQALPRPMSSGH